MQTRPPKHTGTWILAALLCFGISACKVGPDYRAPEFEIPKSFVEAPAPKGGAELVLDREALKAWWIHFGDPLLTELVAEAVAESPTLAAAAARLREARARYVAATGELFPNLQATGRYERSRPSRETQLPAPAITRELIAPGMDLSWELDLFGGIRRGAEAGWADAVSEDFAYRAALVSLVAEVGETYIALRRLDEEQRIAKENLAAQSETLRAVGVRVREGLIPELDLRRAETNVLTTEASVPLIAANIAAQRSRLATLLGTSREALDPRLAAAAAIPKPPADFIVMAPADLLALRPDVRAAERRLAAAVARIGEAEAELFPSFSLTASAVLESNDFTRLVQTSAMNWNFGPSLRFPIFYRDRLRAAVEAADARAEAAYASLQQTVLVSIEEVEVALSAWREEKARQDSLLRAVKAAREGVRQSRVAYEQGLTPFQTVLDAERSLLDLERQAAVTDASVATAVVRIFEAFGGGLALLSDARGMRREDLPFGPSASVTDTWPFSNRFKEELNHE